jgi:hypothetical protein
MSHHINRAKGRRAVPVGTETGRCRWHYSAAVAIKLDVSFIDKKNGDGNSVAYVDTMHSQRIAFNDLQWVMKI